mgnify:CR=1 FL=1
MNSIYRGIAYSFNSNAIETGETQIPARFMEKRYLVYRSAIPHRLNP